MHPWPRGWRLGEAPDLHVLALCHSCSEARPGSQQQKAEDSGQTLPLSPSAPRHASPCPGQTAPIWTRSALRSQQQAYLEGAEPNRHLSASPFGALLSSHLLCTNEMWCFSSCGLILPSLAPQQGADAQSAGRAQGARRSSTTADQQSPFENRYLRSSRKQTKPLKLWFISRLYYWRREHSSPKWD